MAKQITVRVTLDIVVDVEGWDSNYGTGTTVKQITNDVRAYVENEYAAHHLTDEGTIISVTETHSR